MLYLLARVIPRDVGESSKPFAMGGQYKADCWRSTFTIIHKLFKIKAFVDKLLITMFGQVFEELILLFDNQKTRLLKWIDLISLIIISHKDLGNHVIIKFEIN